MKPLGPVNAPIVHPGEVSAERMFTVPVAAHDLVIDLRAGDLLEAAICGAVLGAGFDAAWVDLGGLRADPFAYVMPANSPDGSRVAWYSHTHRPEGGGHVQFGGVSVGRLAGGDFTHCHGLWEFAGGQALGHLLAPECRLSAPIRLQAVGLKGGGSTGWPTPRRGSICFALAQWGRGLRPPTR